MRSNTTLHSSFSKDNLEDDFLESLLNVLVEFRFVWNSTDPPDSES